MEEFDHKGRYNAKHQGGPCNEKPGPSCICHKHGHTGRFWVLPGRWVVERTFGWLNQPQRVTLCTRFPKEVLYRGDNRWNHCGHYLRNLFRACFSGRVRAKLY